MDAAEPPRIVVEGQDRCVDAASVQDLLRQGLARAKAPQRAWVVTMRIASFQGSRQTLDAQGDITNGAGANVAHRFLSGSSAGCGALARALGVWAALVLDAEVARASARPPLRPEVVPAAGPPAPSLAPVEPSAPEREHAATPEDRTGIEFGIGGFFMAETAGGPFAGVTPYLVVDAGHGLFLRPAVAIGDSLFQAGPDAQWFAGRFDACLRWPGLYAKGRGIDITFCGGAEGGFTHEGGPAAQTSSSAHRPPNAAYVALGPSVDLRGEFAENLSAVLRGVGDVDILPAGWSARFELAVSWRMP